jgi:diguanylate cyclase (GGDEF)-like protein
MLVMVVRLYLAVHDNGRLLAHSRREASTDALTGLGNRRRLTADLAAHLEDVDPERPLLLTLFDLDGFKQYNDTFGHPAGDALLARLGERLRTRLVGRATAYRMGGDEFCLLATIARDEQEHLVRIAVAALGESGDRFSVTCSHGSALVPDEAATAEEALRLADQRLYLEKSVRTSAGRQSSDVLLKVLSERSGSLATHASSVGRLARLVAQRLGLPEHEQEQIQLAAELHDIGKTAIPDSILDKPGALTAAEWGYMRSHTLIGERIILAAPSLAQAAAYVRSSHERIDGRGYPDGLAGDEIPIGSRITFVCDAFDAMVSDRSYRTAMPIADALGELRELAGTQFDPQIVELFLTLASELDLSVGGLAPPDALLAA